MLRKMVRVVTRIDRVLPLLILILSCATAMADECDLGTKVNVALCKGTTTVRSWEGLPPLRADPNLNAMAEEMAVLLAELNADGGKKLTHNLPGGNSFRERSTRWGLRRAGENIAAGQRSTGAVMKSWAKSPGHYRNIMAPQFRRIGTGYYRGFWVQVFAD